MCQIDLVIIISTTSSELMVVLDGAAGMASVRPGCASVAAGGLVMTAAGSTATV